MTTKYIQCQLLFYTTHLYTTKVGRFQMKLYMLLLPTYYIIPVLIDAIIPTLKNFKIKVNN